MITLTKLTLGKLRDRRSRSTELSLRLFYCYYYYYYYHPHPSTRYRTHSFADGGAYLLFKGRRRKKCKCYPG